MALYEKPVRTLMWDMIADLKPAKTDVVTRDQVRDWFGRRYPKVKEGTIGAHMKILTGISWLWPRNSCLLCERPCSSFTSLFRALFARPSS